MLRRQPRLSHLGLGIVVQRLLALVTADARGLVAAKGHGSIVDIVAVALSKRHTQSESAREAA